MLSISAITTTPTNKKEEEESTTAMSPSASTGSAAAAVSTSKIINQPQQQLQQQQQQQQQQGEEVVVDDSDDGVEETNMKKLQRRKDLFGDCALVEIIHLHDCLRGALHALEKDLNELSRMVLSHDNNNATEQMSELESRATARFQVIWSVFRAHSAAEDEFIWPALRLKTQGRIQGGCCGGGGGGGGCTAKQDQQQQQQQRTTTSILCCGGTRSDCCGPNGDPNGSCPDELIEQEEYEEDHADEERMFTMMDHLLARLRKGLSFQRRRYQQQQQQQKQKQQDVLSSGNTNSASSVVTYNHRDSIINTMKEIQSLVKTLNQHLMVHLEKEEKQCMPLVVKHLSKAEIHELVGKIMGKRSSDMIAQILTMAVQNLNETDKEEMVKHMKQAMVGTFFDRWLAASGWMDENHTISINNVVGSENFGVMKDRSFDGNKDSNGVLDSANGAALDNKRSASDADLSTAPSPDDAKRFRPSDSPLSSTSSKEEVTSQAELEKLIKAVATNPALTSEQKNTTIQGLRTSVWKRNQRLSTRRPEQVHPPSAYYQRRNSQTGESVLVWKQDSSAGDGKNDSTDNDIPPMFTASELAPTYHHGTADCNVLGCPHYARSCKLRHPISGRLYTCRLCCEQEREASGVEKDQPLDRYAVTEISCMKCQTLQPSQKYCVNPECELHEKGFSNYYCDICHLFDDRPRPIFHCPYCNTCRMGQGLGIDYRHCMRCNACVSLDDDDHHCIPQKLQGSCPICHDSLFNSTEPLKGLKCGHVMHLSCFTTYRRGHFYTCPLCMRSMEDMTDYFSTLDQAVQIQEMPAGFQNTVCNIYCQDCEKTGQCKYHFVGQKCPNCGSYNTREMGRFESTTSTTT